ncbi:MAG: hypothetical protein PVJ84_10485 [Desulfobacteraceae bacterium]
MKRWPSTVAWRAIVTDVQGGADVLKGGTERDQLPVDRLRIDNRANASQGGCDVNGRTFHSELLRVWNKFSDPA